MADNMDIQATIDRATYSSRWVMPAATLAPLRKTLPETEIETEPEVEEQDDEVVRWVITCGICGQEGHNRRTCKNPKVDGRKDARRHCGNCGEEGHYRTTCPEITQCCQAMIERHEKNFSSDFCSLRLSCGSCARIWTWTISSYPIEETPLSTWTSGSGREWEREE